MADTTVQTSNRVQQWADDEFFEYVRGNLFKPYMGTGENSIIQVKEELVKQAGDRVTFSLVTRLSGAGVTDDATLEGNEEALSNYGHQVTVHQLRNGVVVGAYEKIKTKIDLLNAAKIMLRTWNMEQLRDLFIARLLSPVIGGLTTYAAATETEKDAWQVANNPSAANSRILFGATKGNDSSDHSADLSDIDGTADDLHQDIVRLGRRMAQSCSPHIRPVVPMSGSEAGSERFVHFVGSIPFRDLEANMDTVRQNADVRGAENGIFAGGDMRIGNVIVHELPELDRFHTAGGSTLENVGNGGTTEVQATFLCGAQALLLAWAERMQAHVDNFDYGNRRGAAISEIRGCEKSTYNSFQHGVVTIYVSAVGD